MKMNCRYIFISMAAAVLLAASCANEPESGLNDAAKRYFDAWIQYNHPDAVRTELGAYILEDVPGTGDEAGDSAYVRMNYSYYDLDNNLLGTSIEAVARQNGTYVRRKYYGPSFFYRGDNLEGLTAGPLNSPGRGGFHYARRRKAQARHPRLAERVRRPLRQR